MGKADSAVELGVAADLFLSFRHVDQNQGDIVLIASIMQHFEVRHR